MAKRLLIALVVLSALGLLIEALIVTEEERLHAWAEDASAAASRGDTPALRALLADDFTYERRSVDEAVVYALAVTARSGRGSVSVTLENIVIEGDQATADAVLRGTAMGRPLTLRTQASFRREEAGWRLADAARVAWR